MKRGSPPCERAGRKADGGRLGGPVAHYWSTKWHVEDRPETRIDPKGPPFGDARVIRGGSYLCHHSYCNRYRVAARTWNTPDSSTGNTGLRCAAGGWPIGRGQQSRP